MGLHASTRREDPRGRGGGGQSSLFSKMFLRFDAREVGKVNQQSVIKNPLTALPSQVLDPPRAALLTSVLSLST